MWRFVWQIDPEKPTKRYWVEFSDTVSPSHVRLSMQGEGLGSGMARLKLVEH